jgi:hypothetical protein
MSTYGVPLNKKGMGVRSKNMLRDGSEPKMQHDIIDKAG